MYLNHIPKCYGLCKKRQGTCKLYIIWQFLFRLCYRRSWFKTWLSPFAPASSSSSWRHSLWRHLWRYLQSQQRHQLWRHPLYRVDFKKVALYLNKRKTVYNCLLCEYLKWWISEFVHTIKIYKFKLCMINQNIFFWALLLVFN